MNPTGCRLPSAALLAVAVLGWTAGCDAAGPPLAPVAPADTAVATADAQGAADVQGSDLASSSCAVVPASAGEVQKISHLELALSATGCDRNDDGQPDNALGLGLSQVGGMFNARMADNLASGKLVLLLAAPAFAAEGQPFALDLLAGKQAPFDTACPPTDSAANCAYQVLPQSYDTASPAPVCPPRVRFAGVQVQGGLLVAGGHGERVQMPLPIGELSLTLQLEDVRLQGQVALGPSGQWSATSGGVLCGVLTKPALYASVDTLTDADLAAHGFSKPILKAVLNSYLIPDVAVGGTEPNAYSATLRLETVPGHLVAAPP